MSEPLQVSLEDLITALPPRIWYLTSNGTDMWGRVPYGFWFSTGAAAEAFAAQMGSELSLSAIGIDTRDLLGDAAFSALRDLHVTRIFVDPEIDPESGDVHGQILRLGEIN
jgi:hypothetical protein